jgi:hypothetical protein
MPSEFWLQVHELTQSLDREIDEGFGRERILKLLDTMPSIAREQITGELRYLLAELLVLYEAAKNRQAVSPTLRASALPSA